ncbi:peptidase C1-like family [Treponema vincentii ATCC 35580]|uniref:Aminopeptidase n=1 Tax=Treponema vincentii ATCC 35580 TaxID=596324 RepID=C8PS21_9SPIR|nr:C1 family peptidase [Treponema vincentii]EEV19691.1 peptidase C1-like family [Treponema vincentii ATCC 35580]
MNISPELLKKFESDYHADLSNAVIAGAVAKNGIEDASFNYDVRRRHNFCFSDETKRGEITNQKKSGRCWMFASLNAARVETMKKLNLETFELSQNYTLFWDKLEKSNYFFESILETLDEPLEGRLMAHLLSAPIQDGGQWDMFSGILQKYGVVPKDVMPETFHSSDTRFFVAELTHRLRKYAQLLREGHKAGKSIKELRTDKEKYLSHVYSVLVKALGEPPRVFDFECRDKDKNFHKAERITPQQFFKEYVGWNLNDKISLINAPTVDKPYGRAYTVKFLGTVKEAKPIHYINVPIEVLKTAAIESIKAGKPVWFGCDMGPYICRPEGIMDTEVYLYDKTLGELPEFTKAERLDYGDSLLTHAMVLTGVDLDKSGKPIKWQVENSWGDESGKKGMFSMSDAWFNEYTYQIMVEKAFVDQKWLDALKQPLVQLEPWDPMGALARI